jgi:hypothetical protein
VALISSSCNRSKASALGRCRQKAINIGHGVAPGSEQWKQPEATLGSSPMQRVVKVTAPTLMAYLPDAAKVRRLLL